MNDDFFEAYQEFEDSLTSLDRESEDRARRVYAAELENQLAQSPGSRDIYHQLGHCLYYINDWTENDKDRIEKAFQRSLSLDRGSYFSLMFLGFLYYDISEYQLSICCMEALFQHPGKARVPQWRLVKLQGIMIASRLRLDRIETEDLKNSLERLLEQYARLDEDDIECAQPNELVLTLRKSAYSEKAEIARMMGQLEAFGSA